MSSTYTTAFPSVTDLDVNTDDAPVVESLHTYKTSWYISKVKTTPRQEPEVIVIRSIVLENKKTTHIQKHLLINKLGLMATVLAMALLAVTSKRWLILFVVPFFLGFLEMYITVLVDNHSKKVGRKA